MSNLNLPTMTFENIAKKMVGKSTLKLAYATEAVQGNSTSPIEILHHGNRIAVLSPENLYVSNCGWDSSTTATRLRKIMSDNNLGYYVRIRDFGMRLYSDAHTEVDPAFHSATFSLEDFSWVWNAA